MAGAIYNKCRSPYAIIDLSFHEMKYWNKWNKAIDKGYEEAFK